MGGGGAVVSGRQVAMVRKKSLKEVKTLGDGKTRNQEIYAYSDSWEAWELAGEDAGDPDDWAFVADGLLPDCIEALSLTISIDLDYELQEEQERTGKQYEDFFKELALRHQKRQQEIISACHKKGGYKTENWTIRSLRNRHECEWIAKHGNPGF